MVKIWTCTTLSENIDKDTTFSCSTLSQIPHDIHSMFGVGNMQSQILFLSKL